MAKLNLRRGMARIELIYALLAVFMLAAATLNTITGGHPEELIDRIKNPSDEWMVTKSGGGDQVVRVPIGTGREEVESFLRRDHVLKDGDFLGYERKFTLLWDLALRSVFETLALFVGLWGFVKVLLWIGKGFRVSAQKPPEVDPSSSKTPQLPE